MTNPYQPPQSTFEGGSDQGGSATMAIRLIVGLICALIAAALPMLVIPSFQQVFDSFGAQLPLMTQLALSYHLWLWVLPILVIAAFMFWPKAERRPLAACLTGVIGLTLTSVVMILAMYLPVFALGQAI